MFVEPILKRLEHKIQSTVSHASGAAIALVPLLVGVGFGTAAADSYLQERFSPPEAYLILCGAYLVVALVIYMVARARTT
jgi:predicted permease